MRVSKRLAAVTNVGPYLQPTGRDTRLILRGYGFDAVSNLAARLKFTGGTVSQITRVNDTELVVNTGPLNLGTFTFSFTNALNVPTATASVRTYTPQNFAAAVDAHRRRPAPACSTTPSVRSVYLVNAEPGVAAALSLHQPVESHIRLPCPRWWTLVFRRTARACWWRPQLLPGATFVSSILRT